MAATFDGDNLRIILSSGTTTVDVEADLYSAWKEWVKQYDNAKYLQAFDTTGGDTITATENVAPFFFLRNDLGWRIRGPEEDATIAFTGNLFGRDGTLPVFVPTLGGFTQQLTLLVSSRALLENANFATAQETQLLELWQLQGLDVADPMTVTPSARTTQSGDIDLAITGDGVTTSTVTRQ
jgi:hypothetical protein